MPHVLAQDLRNAVLQAAFEGRLTNREKSDSSVYVALKNNSYTRNTKIAEKEIKNDLILPVGETPFEIPDEWTWVRFNEIFSVLNGDRGKNYPAKNTLKKEGSIPFISALNLNGKDVEVDDNLLYLSEEQYEKLNAGKLRTNDTVMCIRGSLGKHGKFQFEKGAIASSLVIIRHISAICDDKYLFYYLDSPLLSAEIRKYDNGTAQPNLAADSLKKFLFPLPPIEEQARIVAKVDELMAKIDEYEKIEKELAELQKAFPGNMKDAILQAAMQGKLTEQLESDTAQKVSPDSFEDEDNLLDIPDSWQWNQLGSVVNVMTGLSFSKQEQCAANSGALRILRGGNILDNYKYGLFDNDVYVSYRDKHTKLEIGDVLSPSVTSMEKMCKVAYIDKELPNTTAGGFVYILRSKDFGLINPRYLMYFFNSDFNKQMCKPNIHKSGQAFYNLKKSGLVTQPLPLPPIEEQQRIVDKLDQLLPLCEQLEKMAA
ncbi:restriction endonuclease subunit S [Stecheria sp. CLA-KB-P133]|uniref:Restriction endonuclease subunit S n=1 Tax=Grylomicrobium aquisgranensis TaxID=2926318 RepID=A0AB35U3U8_9FIRM|nr:restriction endonuclease subunit S [Stecheria sp. CLA-KB-P133]